MGILRSDRVSGLGGANAIVGSTRFAGSGGNGSSKTVTFFKDSSLAPGTSDFCAEAWVYFNWVDGTNNTQIFANLGGNFGFANDTSWAVIRIGSANQFYAWNSSGWQAFGAGAPTVNTWHYIQLVRASNVQTLYMDGTSLGSPVTNSQDLTHDEIGLGARDDGSEGLDGFISNFRLTIGLSAAALAGIVPSAASRVLSTDTKLLCCNDPGNVNNEDAQGIPTSTTSDNDVQMIQGFASSFVPDKGEDHGTTFGDNTKFDTLSYMVPPGGTTTQRGRGRGVVLGGGRSGSPTKINTISYIEIQSTGFSNAFGDLTESVIIAGCCASSTRGVRGGGYNTPTNSNVIDYVTIATTSNATNFGDLTIARHWVMGGGSQTRGIFGGGNMGASPNPNSNTIDYITIASEGNAADFGDLINSYTPTIGSGNGAASPTRLLFAGGSQDTPAPQTVQNAIQYVTIASTGDATDFGDLTDNKVRFGVCSSSTRALYGGAGANDTAKTNSITYVTIATTGNTEDFGDRTVGVNNVAATSNSIRGVFIGGLGSPTSENHIDYVTIATTGNAVDWGDSFYLLEHTSACSDSHGGIS